MSTVGKYAERRKLQLEDATRPVELHVTNDDLKGARTKSPSHCAFAQAACNHLQAVRAAHFLRTTAWLEYKSKMVRYSLPVSVQKEIMAFDRSGRMEPGVYSLLVPAPLRKSGRSGKRAAKTRPAGSRSTRSKIRVSVKGIRRSILDPGGK